MMSLITINIGGKDFSYPKQIWDKIPYFANLSELNNIVVCRSAMLFPQVVELALNPKIKFEDNLDALIDECDYYGLNYGNEMRKKVDEAKENDSIEKKISKRFFCSETLKNFMTKIGDRNFIVYTKQSVYNNYLIHIPVDLIISIEYNYATKDVEINTTTDKHHFKF